MSRVWDLQGFPSWVSTVSAAAASRVLRGVSVLLRSRLPKLRAGLSMCFRAEPQSPVSPEQLLREICRPQKYGCSKGITGLSWVLISLERWEERQGDCQGTVGAAASLTRDT